MNTNYNANTENPAKADKNSMEPSAPNIRNVPRRILSYLLSSVAAGVVPRIGAPYIAIGRSDEIGALLSDLETLNEGGSALRFLIGRYGSGKSFLIQLIRGYALERNFVTVDADLSPERRLYGSNGSGVATYKELIRNMATKASPEGGALSKMILRWINEIRTDLRIQFPDISEEEFSRKISAQIYSVLRDLEDFVGGFDFANVVIAYYHAYLSDAEEKKSACLRWLRGEFATKTEARQALGIPVSCIIDDDNWYDFMKLWAALVRKIGYRGLVMFVDECVNLYKISHRISRENNYEKILSMFNDSLQGRAPGLAIVFGGTPQFLEDTRRGLFSYEALRSRLCDSPFSSEEYKNLIGPVIRLRRLSDEELFALIVRITGLYADYYHWEPNLSNEDMLAFLQNCLARAGADTMITPREMLRDYMTVLNILMQNPKADLQKILGEMPNSEETPTEDGKETSEETQSTAGQAFNGRKKLTEEELKILEF